MFSKGTVTVVTATTGHHNLSRCLDSIQRQTFPNVEHLVVIDGPDFESAARSTVQSVSQKTKPISVLSLPHNTGRDNWCGHRIYAAGSFLANTEFVAFLDEDNWYEPDHISTLLSAIQQAKADWAFSLRNIVDVDGNLVAPDLCESLGNLHPAYPRTTGMLIDTSCYLLRREVAVQVAPIWYGPTWPPPGQWERDRALCQVLVQHRPQVACNLKHTMNYTVGSRSDSVTGAFFLEGNRFMRNKFPQGLPWETRPKSE